MKKCNQWIHGKHKFVAPPLGEKLLSRAGCSFHENVFDPNVGTEVFLMLLEEHEFSLVLAQHESVTMICSNGIGRTSHGKVVFSIFSFYHRQEYLSSYELFLNPRSIETIGLLSSLGEQTHVKVIIYDREEYVLRNLYEFENTYGFDELAEAVAQSIGREENGDFHKAVEEFMNKYSLEELK